jgi:hypothetical protein
LILNKKYWSDIFELINYFPFDRPYDEFRNILEYRVEQNKENIDKLFLVIKKLQLIVNFVKFSKEFFWKNLEFYDFKKWVLEQIWEEDIEVLESKKIPFCKIENRCYSCFLKDKCKWYEL